MKNAITLNCQKMRELDSCLFFTLFAQPFRFFHSIHYNQPYVNMKKLVLVLVLIGIFSCKNDDITEISEETIDETSEMQVADLEDFGDSILANFSGRIIGKNGFGINDVKISIGNQTTFTDHNGVFFLTQVGVFENFAFVKAVKDGYIRGSRTILPQRSGYNDLQITLLDQNIVAVVDANQPSEVAIPNGPKVTFLGEFMTQSGQPYSGKVNVSMHYVAPNQGTTFNETPGMLLGQNQNGTARMLETYGMAAINLFTPSGDPLNILEGTTATIEFPVDASTSNAPNSIPLWYFDEEKGYWREEGQATKVGNTYVGEVSHFSWWNCDIPLEYINFCFTVSADNRDLANHFVQIIRNISGQIIFEGYLNENGQECGLIPLNEEITINVFGTNSCADVVIHSEVVGPFSSDTDWSITVPTLASDVLQTTLTGSAINCSGNPVVNGYLYVYNSMTTGFVNATIIPLENGAFNYDYGYCEGEELNAILYDFDASYASEEIPLNLLPNQTTDLGEISACNGEISDTFFGDVTLRTQNDVDNFGQLPYKHIEGSLRIGHNSGEDNSDIVTLAPLRNLESIRYLLRISRIESLETFEGLHNLKSINSLVVSYNPSLRTMSSLSDLSDDLNSFIIVEFNPLLENLGNLENVNNLSGPLFIASNPSLLTLEALNGLVSVGEVVIISGNDQLISLDGLGSLNNIGEGLAIRDNSLIPDLNALQNLTNVGVGFDISDNDSLLSVVGLSGVTNSVEFLNVNNCNSLQSLDGFENIDSVYDNIKVRNNDMLSDFCALGDVLTVGNIPDVTIVNNLFNPTVQDIIDGNCSN